LAFCSLFQIVMPMANWSELHKKTHNLVIHEKNLCFFNINDDSTCSVHPQYLKRKNTETIRRIVQLINWFFTTGTKFTSNKDKLNKCFLLTPIGRWRWNSCNNLQTQYLDTRAATHSMPAESNNRQGHLSDPSTLYPCICYLLRVLVVLGGLHSASHAYQQEKDNSFHNTKANKLFKYRYHLRVFYSSRGLKSK